MVTTQTTRMDDPIAAVCEAIETLSELKTVDCINILSALETRYACTSKGSWHRDVALALAGCQSEVLSLWGDNL